MSHTVGEFVQFDDGDVGVRQCRVLALEPTKFMIETPSGARLWIRNDNPRVTSTPVHHQHRTNDRPTAVAAATNIRAGSGKLKVLIALHAAGERGLMDWEHEEVNGLIPTSAGKRRLDLLKEGWVRDSGRRGKTPRDADAEIWQLTDAGYTYVASLQQQGAA